MASGKSKAADQQLLSRAELEDGGEAKPLAKLTAGFQIAFATACRVAFGVRWYTRLSNSASRAKRSPIGYAIDVLLG